MVGKSSSIGDVVGINSHAILEGDGKREKIDPNKGATPSSCRGPVMKDPRVSSKAPPRKASWGKVSSP